MEPFSLEWAAECMGGKILGGMAGTVTSVCLDSRQAGPGALFFALQGEKADGHQFVGKALEAGAAGAVVEQEILGVQGAQIVVPAALRALGDLARRYRRQFAIPIVGVTGSVGKTSTKEMIAAVLRTTYTTLANEKNYNNEIGVPLTLFHLNKTHQAAVIEMGMRGLGQIDYLAEIAEPTIGVITNIGHAHIELLGSRENIAKAKAELFARLTVGGTAILRHPEVFWSLLQSHIPPGCRKITFATHKGYNADVWLTSHRITLDQNGCPSFRVRARGMDHSLAIKLKAVGRHHVLNALAALSVAHALDLPMKQALNALRRWEGAEGRMVVHQAANNITILDDCYNASPESMHSALDTLFRMHPQAVAVLGDMKELGEFANREHQKLGHEIVLSQCRLLITVGPLAQVIAVPVEEHKLAFQHTSPEIAHFADAQEAAAHIQELVMPGDTVLVKGSRAMGMEVIVDALTGETGRDAHA